MTDIVKGMKGLHHVALGVEDYPGMKEFYTHALECSRIWLEFTDLDVLPEVFRTANHKFHATLCGQDRGNVMIELIGLTRPAARPMIHKRYGDIGVNKITIAVTDIEKFYSNYEKTIQFLSEPKAVLLPDWGEYRFIYGRDPEGNLLEFIAGPKCDDEKDAFGGLCWAGVAVTDLTRSMSFYQSMAFDTVVIGPHEEFSGLIDEVSGFKGTDVRSCLLSNSRGGGMLEVYECLKPRGRSIPLNTYWGDYGYLEIATIAEDIREVATWCKEHGLYFLHNPVYGGAGSPGKEWWIQYTYDPDGIPVETISEMPVELLGSLSGA